jgi:hypothetical protein
MDSTGAQTHAEAGGHGRDQFTHYRADGENVDTTSLDTDIKTKMDGKYDIALQNEVVDWMVGLGVWDGEAGGQHYPATPDIFMEQLKSGVILCELANTLRPGSVKNVSHMSVPFKQMDNIGQFLSALPKLGLQQASDSFMTVDLYDNKDKLAVLTCLASLSGAGKVQKSAGLSAFSSVFSCCTAPTNDEAPSMPAPERQVASPVERFPSDPLCGPKARAVLQPNNNSLAGVAAHTAASTEATEQRVFSVTAREARVFTAVARPVHTATARVVTR